ncbi:MAG TPA: NADP-dependent succinic semialdehyde dehydrogenase [Acidimicrobiales bacterium]|nr:NADP-dependent succinic semialdehyde dehydrogenase [Acidimicrobiales bacterium]
MTIASVNPTTGETLKTFEPHDEAEVERRLALADRAFRSFRRTAIEERAALVRKMADLLDEDKASLAETMTLEMGKPVVQARGEVTKCAAGLRFYAEHAAAMLADEPVTTTAAKHGSYVKYQPIGPVLAVMPWNFPMWQVIRFAAPTFMAGNVALLKHASNVPQVALYLEDAARRAGFPDGVFQTLLVGSDRVQAILEDDRVKAATLTGSEAAGRSVAAIAGRAIKKTVLELGGADPFIVMPSADIERAVEVGLWARIQNNGQSCIAAKRFIVHEAIADEYEERYGEAMSKLVIGDPLDEATQIGPLATAQGRDEVNAQVTDALSKGAKALCGGGTVDGPGWFVQPTALSEITPEMRVYRDEVFGPVTSFFRVANIDEAIALANDTDFGLGSNAWTEDPAEQRRFADELEAGMVFINSFTVSYFDLPFGGVKRSGYGRELTHHGIREFTDIKTVWVD